MKLWDELEYRGLSYQATDGVQERLDEGPVTVYCGFDPTADSLTIGNLVVILLLRRFQLAGHSPIALVGGGTGLIGDPGGRSSERSLSPQDVVEEWSQTIRTQIEPFLDFEVKSNPARLVNNYEWLGSMGAIELMRDVGKHFPVPYMLAKESVSSRLQVGISFTEFSYMILQSYDFLQVHERFGCELQVGASDQWGNITAGSDLIRRTKGGGAYGFTCPLVTRADGSKISKSEGTAVWLSPELTTPYEFYQFWVNVDDQTALNFLKIYTFLTLDEITQLEEATANDPGKREAQRTLACEVTTLLHGAVAATKAEKISRALFYGKLRELAEDELREGFHDVPTHDMVESEIGLIDLLVASGVSSSKRQARQDISSGAIYLNGKRCADLEHTVRKADGLHGKYVVIRRGKNKCFLVQ
ncbi:MAG: tyrosine--tRNA ligase [Candidatus Latescibacterota bacterium]|nr:tyrosine--tRNA ligase [Candidatus Latescibacterota bacterium]